VIFGQTSRAVKHKDRKVHIVGINNKSICGYKIVETFDSIGKLQLCDVCQKIAKDKMETQVEECPKRLKKYQKMVEDPEAMKARIEELAVRIIRAL
jgi:NADH:ubiquinone oxidoreductase subunit D